jgi:hypothetical protein
VLALPLKKTLLASETDRADIVRARHVWRTYRQPWMTKRPERLVFIDETGTTTKMTRLRGRARRGQRLSMKAPSAIGAPRRSSQPCAMTG